ncbi:MAG TPA: DoxX family protein [Pyrinomonadaceae bacterium]
MFQKLIRTSRVWFTLPLRLALGAVFVAHGAQKVLGLWGGPGLAQFASGQAPLGLKPAWFWLGAAALAELVGGALVLMGLMTRLGALLLLSVMLVAMFGVHWTGGFFITNQPMPGIEYTLALAGMALALLVSGGGRLSLDEALMDPRYRRR